MPVSIHIKAERNSSTYAPAMHIAHGRDMKQALATAKRWAESHELAWSKLDPLPPADRTLYLYDSLGGLRCEVRRRDGKVSFK